MEIRARVRVAVCVWVSVTAIVLSTPSPLFAQDSTETASAKMADVPSDLVLKHEHILLLKSTLNLRPTQEQYWLPVEAALQDMARWQAGSSASGEGTRSHAAVMTRIKRISVVAVPLIKALDDQQRQAMTVLVRSAGLEEMMPSTK